MGKSSIHMCLEEQGSMCFYCKKELRVDQATVDHFIPKAAGGTNSHLNKVAACKQCNGNKGDSMPTESQLLKLHECKIEFFMRLTQTHKDPAKAKALFFKAVLGEGITINSEVI